MPSVVRSDHGYLLLRQGAGGLEFVSDDDPLYATYQEHVLVDPYLLHLLALFDHTTAAIIATEMPSSFPQTVANRAAIIIDSQEAGLLHQVSGRYETSSVKLELAMGLGDQGRIDADFARQQVPRVVGQLLLAILERPTTGGPQQAIALSEITDPNAALHVGFQAALDALYGQSAPQRVIALRLRTDLSAAERDLLSRYDDIPRNALRYRHVAGQPTSELLTPQQAMCTPGVVASFFFRLFGQTTGYYPQREMLWFANYEDDDRTDAQVLLPFRRMGRGDQGIAGYLARYCETFPSEAASVRQLAIQVFGADPLALTQQTGAR